MADNLNHGFQHADLDSKVNLLLQSNGSKLVRAMVTDKYTRIWNADITSRLIRLTEKSPVWQPAPAAFDGSRGLYASDHDMFAFLVDNERRIFEKGPGGGLGRGFFAWNSEVGASVFGIMAFWYEYICGNHRVWGAQNVTEIRLRHVGNADDRAFGKLAAQLKKYANSSVTEDEAKIEAAHKYMLGGTKDEVLDKVFGLDTGVTRKLISEAYDKAIEHSDWCGSPNSAWGLTGGMTEIARDAEYTDARVSLDRAAGKILAVAF